MADLVVLVVSFIAIVLCIWGCIAHTRPGEEDRFWAIVSGTGLVVWVFVAGTATLNIFW